MEKFYEKFQNSKNKKSKSQKTEKKEFKSFKKVETFSENLISTDGKIISVKNLFHKLNLDENAKNALENFDSIIKNVIPLNSRQLTNLPKNINSLSHSLTDERETRRLGYMNSNEELSAYVHYFTWWNLIRLCKIFSNFREEDFSLSDGDFCADFGSGPLTVLIALWISCPFLRNKNLNWYCVDISAKAMSIGEELFYSIAAKCPALENNSENSWKIIRVKGELGINLKNKVKFITSANMFNEIAQNSEKTYEEIAQNSIRTLQNYGTEDCSYFIAEPGIPTAAHFISLCRAEFVKSKMNIKYPCTHLNSCCMNGKNAKKGGKSKWCNFDFLTEDSPQKLLKLSEQAKLPKNRIVLSFIFASKSKNQQNFEKSDKNSINLRITSDSFSLPENKIGFYACSNIGFILLSTTKKNKLQSADLLQIELLTPVEKLKTDSKSGAKIISL